RSDIFSFGCILFEVLTGRKAFLGDTQSALVTALCGAPAPPTGNPAVDRLLAGCFAKNPEDRWPRMQKIQLELKLIIASAGRVEGPPPQSKPTPQAAAAVTEKSLRIEMAQLEARVNARLAANEQMMAQIQIAVNDAITNMRGQLSTLSMRISTAH